MEALPAGAYTCDRDGLITYFNRHAVHLWGRAPRLNDPRDRFCGSFKLLSPKGAPIEHDECCMALALRTDTPYNGHEMVVERPDGRRVAVLAHANPIRDEAGLLVGAMNVLVDISDRRTAEDENAWLYSELRGYQQRKDEFLATLAHELRNPLAPIRNAVQILRMQPAIEPNQSWATEVIERQVAQLARLVNDLLDLSRITTGKLELVSERIELAHALSVAVETSAPLIAAGGQELAVALPTHAMPVEGDLTRLAQVIANLLNNAAKYTDRGGKIWLEARQEGSQALVSVRDTGIGISAESLPRIFDMFDQGDGALDRSLGGLGIGLTLVRRLVELHGGSITARSDGRGKGSEFVIRLRIAEGVAAQQAPRGERLLPERAPLRILVVDDNHDAAASLALLLQLKGHDTRIAEDGLEAVAVAGDFRPDAVLLDIGLPRLDGYEAARRIRQLLSDKRVLLIAATGWGQQADRERSQAAGFDRHLVKPADPAVVLDLLDSFRQDSAREASTGASQPLERASGPSDTTAH
jgi:signal transduction histidine kinase/ActR/RegA family two-component response regulator